MQILPLLRQLEKVEGIEGICTLPYLLRQIGTANSHKHLVGSTYTLLKEELDLEACDQFGQVLNYIKTNYKSNLATSATAENSK